MGHFRWLGACGTGALAGVLSLTLALPAAPQTNVKAPADAKSTVAAATGTEKLQSLLAANVKSEWDAFQKKDKKAYSDLLADDFAAVEDDNQGMRTKTAAAGEVDRSNINKYNLYALKVIPLNPNAALVTYELTMLFPPKVKFRFKRVLVSELWVKRDGKWLERYYQETHVR
jgi:hypothetical protein